MTGTERFFDTNVLLYLLSGDEARAERAEEEVAKGGIVSVQVLNEFAAVASRRLAMSFVEIRDVLRVVRTACKVVPLGEDTHDLALQLAQRHRLSMWDSLIIASARLAECRIVLSEDMQDGQLLAGLRVRNPFRR